MSSTEQIYRRAPIWLQTLLLNAHGWRIGRHRYGASYRKLAAQLLEWERWPRERLRAYQDERLREIVRTAYAGSPYYRGLLDQHRIRPADIRGVVDLSRLPVLPKSVVRARGRELQTQPRPQREWLNGHTSGTTGSPLSLWYDRATCIWTNAVDRRQKAWGGMVEEDWIGVFLGRVVVPLEQQRPPFWRRNWMQRQVWFSSFHMSGEWLGQYVAEIRRLKLRFLEGYPSTLYILASYLRRRGETLPLRAAFSSSETLLDMQREVIEQAFACPLFDFYGMAERVVFGAECECHAGKHLAEEYAYVEIVNEAGEPVPDGQPGYVVGTSLHNRAMPLLRYRTSDVSAMVEERCACGRSLRRLRNVTTKAEDLVLTPDGRLISPSILTHPFKPIDQIRKSQIVQDRLDHLTVKIVVAEDFTAAEEHRLVSEMQARVGQGVGIDIEVVDDIPPEPSGKYRWVISRVPHDQRLTWDVVVPGDGR